MKKLLNRKILLGSTSILLCIVLIAICSFIPFVFNPESLSKPSFWFNEALIVAITIFSLISALFIGQASNGQNEKSNIVRARNAFFDTVKKILNINYFAQWIKKVLQPRDIQAIKERKMRLVGIEDFSVLELEYAEIKSLLEMPQKYNGKFYKGLSKEQIDTILKIKRKGIKIDLVDPDYYLSVKNLTDNRTISERSSKEGIKKGLFLTRSVIFKVLITIMVAVIFGAFVAEISDKGIGQEAIGQFVARLWALVSSSFMGYIVGCQINDIDAEYIEMRVNVQNMFLQDKEFKPIDTQEEAKQAFIERVKEEQVLQIEKRDIV
jgi:hypothetical protein